MANQEVRTQIEVTADPQAEEIAEIDVRRAEAVANLGKETVSFVVLPDGSVAPKSMVEKSRDNGEEPYKVGR